MTGISALLLGDSSDPILQCIAQVAMSLSIRTTSRSIPTNFSLAITESGFEVETTDCATWIFNRLSLAPVLQTMRDKGDRSYASTEWTAALAAWSAANRGRQYNAPLTYNQLGAGATPLNLSMILRSSDVQTPHWRCVSAAKDIRRISSSDQPFYSVDSNDRLCRLNMHPQPIADGSALIGAASTCGLHSIYFIDDHLLHLSDEGKEMPVTSGQRKLTAFIRLRLSMGWGLLHFDPGSNTIWSIAPHVPDSNLPYYLPFLTNAISEIFSGNHSNE